MERWKEILRLREASSQEGEPVARRLEDYYKLSAIILGRGSFSCVERARNRETGELVAMKTLDKNWGDEHVNDLVAEVRSQMQFDHAQIVRVLDVFETKYRVYIVQELMRGGMLFDRIADANKISEAQASQVMREILLGVKHMHGRGVVHRYINPENILCSSKEGPWHVKLADFGFASILNRDRKSADHDLVGALDYIAPEIVRNEPHELGVDVWSCGVVLYNLLSGTSPFGGRSDKEAETKRRIANAEYSFPEKYWAHISQAGIRLVRGMMQRDPEKRLTADGALQHEFLRSPGQLKRTHTGNDMRGIHSNKLKKAMVGVVAAKKMQMLLRK